MDEHLESPRAEAPPTPMPAPEHREPWAWAFLAAVFLLMILLEVGGSFKTADSIDSKLGSAEARLDAAISLKESVSTLGALSKQQSREVEAILKGVAQDAYEWRKESPRAARLFAAAQRELKAAIKPEDLSALQYSFSPSDQAIAEIYANDRLTQDEARSLASMVEGKSISDKLARAHALESAGVPNARSELAGQAWARVGLVLVFVILALGGLGIWVAYFVARNRGMLKPLGFPVDWISRNEADRLAFVVGMFLLLMSLVHVAFAFAALLIAFSPRFRLLTSRISLWSVVGEARGLGRHLAWALGGLLANVPVLMLAVGVATTLMRFVPEPSHPIVETLKNSPSPMTLAKVFFAAVVVAPIIEEIVFRGMLMPAIGRVLGSPGWGIALSSFLFASIHPQGVAAWLALGGVGAMCGLLTYHTRSLLPGMLLHALHNGTLLVLNLWISP